MKTKIIATYSKPKESKGKKADSKWLDEFDKRTNKIRNWVAKDNKHKGGSHKSKKDYDRKSLRKRLKKYLKGLKY